MISIKADIYKALADAFEPLGIKVFGFFPDELEQFPLVVFLEENNLPYQIVDDKEVMSEISYRVDVWSEDSTTEHAILINDVFFKFGIRRTLSADIPDVTGLKHKMMKFEGILDLRTKLVYSK